MIRIGLLGLGKTGKEIAAYILNQKNAHLVMAVSRDGSEKVGKDLGEILGTKDTGIYVEPVSRLSQSISQHKPHVIIDFSSPESTVRNIKTIAEHKVKVVIGTTGLSRFSQKRVYLIANKYKTGVVFAPNITFGINVMMMLADIASNILSDYDFEITEVHHKHKKDAPSGTAIKLADQLRRNLPHNNINVSAIRAGGVIGKHTLMIVGEEDKIEISHESFSRRVFAEGALKAAYFIKGKVGYYEMRDVLNVDRYLEKYLKKDISRKKVATAQYAVK